MRVIYELTPQEAASYAQEFIKANMCKDAVVKVNGINVNNKIELIRFMRDVVKGIITKTIPLNQEGDNVGLATTKEYVEKYFNMQ